MNKKIIKYLIWNILIAIALILMSMNIKTDATIQDVLAEEDDAEISIDEFKTSTNLFCLNKGFPFSKTESFQLKDFSVNEFKEITGETVDTDVLRYIVSEANDGRYKEKTGIGNYIPQIAIWKLSGASDSVINASADNNNTANMLIAKAKAYKEFLKCNDDTTPIIEKNGTNEIAIKYYQTNGDYNGTAGTYTNLLFDTIRVEGAANPKEEDLGNQWHKIIYTKESGATEVKVSFDYEISRDATFKIFKSKENIERTLTTYKVYTDSDAYESFLLIQDNKAEDSYICHDGIGAFSDECRVYTAEEILKIFSENMYSISNLDIFSELTADGYTFWKCDSLFHPVFAVYTGTDNSKVPYKIIVFNQEGHIDLGYVNTKYYDDVLESVKQDTYSSQNLLYGTGSIETNSKSDTIKIGLDVTINKTDSLTPNLKLDGASFRIELSNIKELTGYSNVNTTKQIVNVTTNSNGQINLSGIMPNDENNPITIKITETAVPSANEYYYKKLENPIEIKLEYNSEDKIWKKTSGSGTLSRDKLTVDITNTPYITLNGMVWQDGQTGEKGNVAGPDGLKDGEQGIEGVEVYLCNTAGIILSYKNALTGDNKTDANGQYEFKDIPKINDGYRVIFKYNGINYQETKAIRGITDISDNEHSDASEDSDERREFNNGFKTISKNTSNDGTELSYTYNSEDKTSTLNSTIAGHTTGTTDTKFQISAQTAVYTNTARDVDCGLVKKEFDLAIGTDVKEATLKINDKETKYTYAQIMNGELNADFQNKSSTADVDYNLYLYSSDYNYRIGDYKTDIGGNNVPDNDNNNIADFENINNMEAYVTYSVVFKNQTTQNATVDDFVYYYDEVYTPHNIVSTDKYMVAYINSKERKIVFQSKGNGLNVGEDNDYRTEIELTFKIKNDANGNLIVNETATNIAEITRYSTDEGGLIDRDSAPGNGITNGEITQYEDDTDEAKGLNIVLRTDEKRIISGTVFDDKDKDGIKNNNDTVVNDVIVQLIEIKKIGETYYEYIWQETKSGSNEVKTTARNGYTGNTYTNNVQAASGMYEFKDFIPGNYIIRFIYGDGTTYDLTDNVKTYNGQDYKSTIDQNYNKAWYNTAGYEVGQSIARDNEARRLEVMANTVTINESTEISLENTWMCAETSRINIPVDADNTDTDSSSTIASYNYTNNNTKVLFGDMNFGLALRPQTKLALEKHITGLKITPNGTGVQSIIDASKDIEAYYDENTENDMPKGITQGLATIPSTRDERGFWQVATDVEELMQGAELEVEYTYVLRNDGETDYLSNTLIDAYKNQDASEKSYSNILTEIKDTVKGTMRSGTYSYSNNNEIGNYLGQYYYIGVPKIHGDVNKDGVINDDDVEFEKDVYMGKQKDYILKEVDINGDGRITSTDYILLKRYMNEAMQEYGIGTQLDQKVPSRVEIFEEALNNDLGFNPENEEFFKKVNSVAIQKPVYNVAGENKMEEIDTVVQNISASTFLTPGSKDDSKTITLRKTLSIVAGGELGANMPSYIAEIVQYSNAAGRIDMNATPANLSYVHSDDTEMTMANSNETDEFWGESIIITKPTGEDKLTIIQIALITISAVAVLGVGIVLIKKIVLKK